MSAEENKAIIRRWFESANQKKLDIADELFAPDYVLHNPDIAEGVHGPEGIKCLVSMYLNAFPDLGATIEDMFAEGNKVVTCWTFRGTHQGELMGIPPTHKQVTVTAITISRIGGGQITEDWNNLDTLGMLRQLGTVPSPT